ncbi:MAG TPA: hypothetical protein VKB57_10985 [Acidimicrobiales bacterium]|nr:hypothetical protein [Acidimicrobiales bacterium]
MHLHTPTQAQEAPGATAPGANPVVDIGDDVGALVVYLDAVTPSGELEACPAGRPGERFHTGVHLRDLGGGSVAAAVYPQVRHGSYQILDEEYLPLALVHVEGGSVAELDLRSA